MYYAGNQHNRMTEMISHLPDFRWSKHNRGRLILVWRWTYLGGWFDLVSPGDAAKYRFSQISKKYQKKTRGDSVIPIQVQTPADF